MKFATKTIHAGQPSEPETGSLIAPIFQTSTYEQEGPGEDKGFNYSRTNNPTRQRLETILAELEGVEYAAVFASGLAAENAVLQAYLRPGDEIVIPNDVYGGTYRILNKVFQPIGVTIKQFDISNLEALEAAITRKTKLVWIETPTNPRLLIYDIAETVRLAHAKGALVVVDNTFATPYFQQPFELGADIVVHSVTKYLGGHSDTIQGAALAKDPAIFEPIKFLQNATGAVPSPFDCWLTLRGLKTLELRMQRHEENAIAIANALKGHPLVRQVYFPGLRERERPGGRFTRGVDVARSSAKNTKGGSGQCPLKLRELRHRRTRARGSRGPRKLMWESWARREPWGSNSSRCWRSIRGFASRGWRLASAPPENVTAI